VPVEGGVAGVRSSLSEIGDAENISKRYVSRILRLALLAPDIVEAILTGSTDQGMMLEQLELVSEPTGSLGNLRPQASGRIRSPSIYKCLPIGLLRYTNASRSKSLQRLTDSCRARAREVGPGA
jgi:hypothetical protein